MDILIFIYNIFLIVLYTMVLTFCIINYRHKKRQLTAATAVLFLFYILDNIIIYMTEFLDGFSVRYDLQFMSAPAFKTLIFLVTSFCLVSIQHQVLPRALRPQPPVHPHRGIRRVQGLALLSSGPALYLVSERFRTAVPEKTSWGTGPGNAFL